MKFVRIFMVKRAGASAANAYQPTSGYARRCSIDRSPQRQQVAETRAPASSLHRCGKPS
jgi:hypothetical protein